MMKYIALLMIAVLQYANSFSQPAAVINKVQRPRLVVGIVVDQMRWDYLYKYYPLYSSNGGFKRLLNKGFSCENTLIPYTPTVTAAGHTCAYTGSVPAINGIVGNDWYDNIENKEVYCAEDDSAATVGASGDAGKMSPRNNVVTTITDELRIATNYASKVIGISIKDRGAIFPAGHVANAAYWYDHDQGKFITSTYYMNELPRWVNAFNDRSLPDSFYKLNWNLSLPASTYKEYAGEDEQPYENKPFGNEQAHFPYTLNGYVKKDYSKIASTPYGNTLLEAMAEAVVLNENLGKNSAADFLAVSFSSPDYIGHAFGPDSWEQMDDYIKLDAVFGKFFAFLDRQVGEGNYLVFLTADHAVANSPGYAVKHRLPGGPFDAKPFTAGLKQLLLDKYKTDRLIKGKYNGQILLNSKELDSLNLDRNDVEKTIISYAESQPGIARAVSMRNLNTTTLTDVQKKMFSNSYFPQRSSDILIVLKPGYVEGNGKGTSHGLWNPYDAHIPLLFYGWNVKAGKTNRETYMTDIAPTIAAMLHIQMPSGCIGRVIPEVFEK
ncbi:alkaline phosphatase PafA [Parafilimonas sp.]|uniref:alkaline phosphatase PafA n=1 Tax=Parafilimonas sp. TaxID=1969739 RepID=UPI0039E29BD2